MSAELTSLQKKALHRAILASQGDSWVRAENHGQRVTFASLFHRGWLERRAWRGIEGTAAAAYEYRAKPEILAIWNETESSNAET